MLTRLRFREWMLRARRGDRLVYYQGYLAEDRGDPDNKDRRTEDQQAIHALVEAVREAWQHGAVTLMQKRNGPGLYDYYAIRL